MSLKIGKAEGQQHMKRRCGERKRDSNIKMTGRKKEVDRKEDGGRGREKEREREREGHNFVRVICCRWTKLPMC